MPSQLALLAPDPVALDAVFRRLRRRELGEGAWIEHQPGWLSGDDAVLGALLESTRWRAERREMYDRVVDVPRLTARIPADGPGHPVLDEARDLLDARYGASLESISLAWYRDGSDSVAMHGDRVGRSTRDCVVALVSLGAARRFLLQPARGGPSLRFDLGHGDLLVMGGTCQRTWRHGVPKTRSAGSRVSVQFRPVPAG